VKFVIDERAKDDNRNGKGGYKFYKLSTTDGGDRSNDSSFYGNRNNGKSQ